MTSNYINYGIDLGTTNSCIAFAGESDVKVYQNNSLMNVTPSAVYVHKSGRLIIGPKAYNARINDPANVATDFKRLMGQKYEQIFPASGRRMTPEELSAEILKSLIADVRRQTDEDVKASVITVPAAFGAYQCEATAQAAKMAGIGTAPLLQEPIAAAIAYGIRPGVKDQYWLVFDLGGGTLDIAVISTRDGRLTVLEHQGDNFLGGKDIDRLLVEKYYLPALSEHCSLPDQNQDIYNRLSNQLLLKAEQDKIALSDQPEVIVNFDDLDCGIEDIYDVKFTLTRADVEAVFEPLLEKCLRLTKDAIAAARIDGKDIDRILLVGGPTQMPICRSALKEALGADIDYSIDPMTVVARGAALYASTIEIDSPSACIPTSSSGSKIAVKLAFEPTCPDLNCVVAGKIDGNTVKEIQIDSKSGFWSSGWIPVSKEDRYFETDVTLQEMKMNVFYLYARDGKGTLIEVEPGDFSIRQGLAISSPPLPRAVCVEIIQPDGTAILEPLFTKGTLLPIERTHKFRSNKNLRPSEPGSFLAIKIWEGEELSEPQNNTHIGNVYIRSELLRRPIPEGTEIELSIKIDSSRLTAVDAFVPYLNDHFTEQLYVSNKIDSIDRFQNQMPADVDNCINRCAQISSYLPGDQEIEQADNELADLQKQVENLDMSTASKSNWSSKDADRAAQLDSTLHDISLKLWKIEQKHGIDIKRETNDEEDAMVVQEASAITEKYGTELEKKRLSMLKDGLNHLSPDRDSKRKKRIIEELNSLRWGILFRQPWYLKDLFNDIKCNAVFTNKVESNRWLSHGEKAISEGNLQNLRESIGHLFKLLPAGIEEVTKESAVPADLRRY